MIGIQQLARNAGRYIKDFLLLPLNVRQLIELPAKSPPTNPFEGLHQNIRDSLKTLKAEYSEGLVRVDGANYIINPTRTIETLNEVVLRRDYDFAWPSGRYVVIDIGMNVGFATICKARDPNVIHVYGFEPLAPTYNLARRNIEVNPELAHKITSFNIGLADAESLMEIKYCENEIMSVSSEGTFDDCFWGEVRTETIAIKPAAKILGEIFAKHNGVPIFLKCDCEGAEFKIFSSLYEHGLMDQISVVVVEWHGRPPDEIINMLTAAGFSCFSQVINIARNVGIIRAVRMASGAH
jgi:FkbM family methyltransferase